MKILENFKEFDRDSLFEVLKPYQRRILDELLLSANQNLELTAEKWLTMTGSPNIVAFGGIKTSKPFWNNFKKEFHKFLCDDNAYIEDKNHLKTETPVSKTVLISVFSAALGNVLGVSATLLAPAVVLMLIVVFKMGISAYCQIKVNNENDEVL